MISNTTANTETLTLILSGIATIMGIVIAFIQLWKRPLRATTQEQVDVADSTSKIVQSALELNAARVKMIDEMRADIDALKKELEQLRGRIPVLEKENAELKELNSALTAEVEALRIRIRILEQGKNE